MRKQAVDVFSFPRGSAGLLLERVAAGEPAPGPAVFRLPPALLTPSALGRFPEDATAGLSPDDFRADVLTRRVSWAAQREARGVSCLQLSQGPVTPRQARPSHGGFCARGSPWSVMTWVASEGALWLWPVLHVTGARHIPPFAPVPRMRSCALCAVVCTSPLRTACKPCGRAPCVFYWSSA